MTVRPRPASPGLPTNVETDHPPEGAHSHAVQLSRRRCNPAPASMPFNDGPPKRIPRSSGPGCGIDAGQPVGEGDGEDVGGMPGVTGLVGRTVGFGVFVVVGCGVLVAVGAGVGADVGPGGDGDVRVNWVGGTLVGRAAGA